MPDETPNPNWTQAPPPPVDPVAAVPPAGFAYPPPPPASVPNPTLAGFLGLIPGVGAMYNGQFAKAIAHFIIFAVLASMADHHDFFGILVAGWIFYQAFEAYHTARARRDGLPLPNPFGLNDIGERFGFNKSWTTVAVPPAAYPPYSSASQGYPPAPPAYPPAAQANAFGYVPPAAYATPPPVVYPPVPPAEAPHVYAETYTGTAPGGSNAVPPYAATPYTVPPAPPSRFPVAAIVLIIVGVMILLGNLLPNFHINGEWIVPIVLFAAAGLLFARRFHAGGNVIGMLRFPVVLATLGVLFTLEAAHIATLGQTWPVLLLAIGGVLLLERTVPRTDVPLYPPPPPASPLDPPGGF